MCVCACLCVCACVCVCVGVGVGVGVAEARTHVFNMFVSSAKVFVSSMKPVRLQHQKCLSPAQSAFVASNKPVHQQCDSYLEVTSRYYLIASDERIRLQCEVMFRGKWQRLSRSQR